MTVFDHRPRAVLDTNVLGELAAVDGQSLHADFVRVARDYASSLAPSPTWQRNGNENDIPTLLAQAVPEMAHRFDAKYGVEPRPPASVRCDAHIRSHTLLGLHQ